MNRLLIVLMALMSEPLLACAVCGVGKEESRMAFLVTTGILTVIPLTMIGFIVHYIYRQVKARESVIEETATL
jgi:hypothetical protein